MNQLIGGLGRNMIKKAIFALAMLLTASAASADIVLDMTLAGGVDNTNLVSGQSYEAIMSLAAPSGTIESVRLMQFDHRETTGSSVDSFTWNIGGGTIDDSLYFKEVWTDIPTVARANYTGFDPIPGFILDLTTDPIEVGRYGITFQTPGALDVTGPLNDDANRDEGLYFQTGFDSEVETYFIAKGNIIPGGQSSAPGVLPLVPEPTSLGLLGLGALALLRRRVR
jgi:hypothetical protein